MFLWLEVTAGGGAHVAGGHGGAGGSCFALYIYQKVPLKTWMHMAGGLKRETPNFL